ncbi:hypothetical protein RJT34_16330 [Clitoria ternatea]|uniref:Uncharacterized protein n=1 Tax=Clitoria ternatea TaxID=43366 RepID=A0AAN9PDK4_CLITE
MIIKRNLKSQMPSLKWVKLGDPVGEKDECLYGRKKKKTNSYYPLNLLEDVVTGVILVGLHGLLSARVSEKGFSALWCIQVLCSPGELESNSKNDAVQAKKNQVQRPPLV